MKPVSDKNTRDELLAAFESLVEEIETSQLDITIKRVSTRAKKQEILMAYQELVDRYRQLAASPPPSLPAAKPSTPAAVETPPLPVPATPSPTLPKPQRPAEESPMAATPAPSTPSLTMAMDQIVNALNGLGEQFNGALSQLSTQLMAEIGRRREVSEAVATLTTQLISLYDIREIHDDTLKQLIEQYDADVEAFATARKARADELAAQWQSATATWQEEIAQQSQAKRERAAHDKRQFEREAAEYRYQQQLAEAQFAEAKAALAKQRQLALQEAAEKTQAAWAEREAALAAQEKEFAELKAKVDGFEQELAAATKKAKEEGGGIARQQARIKQELAGRDFDGEAAVSQLQIHGLEADVSANAQQLDKLTQQLDLVLKQTQELAMRAIEGSSQSASFQALREITLEQAKSQAKGK